MFVCPSVVSGNGGTHSLFLWSLRVYIEFLFLLTLTLATSNIAGLFIFHITVIPTRHLQLFFQVFVMKFVQSRSITMVR